MVLPGCLEPVRTSIFRIEIFGVCVRVSRDSEGGDMLGGESSADTKWPREEVVMDKSSAEKAYRTPKGLE